MLVLTVCRHFDVDHNVPVVTGAFYKVGGYALNRRPDAPHSHSDGVEYAVGLVRAVDEHIPTRWPHRMKNGVVVADGAAYLQFMTRYVP